MKKINNLFLFFCLVFSIAFFVSCDCEVNKNENKDVTPPGPISNLTAKCTASGTVKLIWTNPADADFAKVVITYDTSKTVEVNVKDTPNTVINSSNITNSIVIRISKTLWINLINDFIIPPFLFHNLNNPLGGL